MLLEDHSHDHGNWLDEESHKICVEDLNGFYPLFCWNSIGSFSQKLLSSIKGAMAIMLKSIPLY